MKSTKGTPRKRPYDVKRKLVRAIERAKAKGIRVISRGFGDIHEYEGVYEVETCGCAVSCYLDGRPAVKGYLVGDAASDLGLEAGEVEELICGFDAYSENKTSKWYKVGQELRQLTSA